MSIELQSIWKISIRRGSARVDDCQLVATSFDDAFSKAQELIEEQFNTGIAELVSIQEERPVWV